jgi:hypothetical protein
MGGLPSHLSREAFALLQYQSSRHSSQWQAYPIHHAATGPNEHKTDNCEWQADQEGQPFPALAIAALGSHPGEAHICQNDYEDCYSPGELIVLIWL